MGGVPRELTHRSVLSYCGRLLNHFPACGWLGVAVTFFKRKVDNLTSSWDEVVSDDHVKTIIEEVASEQEKIPSLMKMECNV